jgi:hypothetical protein
MTNQDRAARLPFVLRAYATVAVIAFGWTVLVSILFLIFVVLPISLEENGLALGWQEWIIAVLFIINLVYAAYFLSSSIAVLWKKRSWLRVFRLCALILNGYCLLCVVGQLVVLLFLPRDEIGLGIAVVSFMAALAAFVTLVTRRLLRHLSNPEVVDLFH